MGDALARSYIYFIDMLGDTKYLLRAVAIYSACISSRAILPDVRFSGGHAEALGDFRTIFDIAYSRYMLIISGYFARCFDVSFIYTMEFKVAKALSAEISRFAISFTHIDGSEDIGIKCRARANMPIGEVSRLPLLSSSPPRFMAWRRVLAAFNDFRRF